MYCVVCKMHGAVEHLSTHVLYCVVCKMHDAVQHLSTHVLYCVVCKMHGAVQHLSTHVLYCVVCKMHGAVEHLIVREPTFKKVALQVGRDGVQDLFCNGLWVYQRRAFEFLAIPNCARTSRGRILFDDQIHNCQAFRRKCFSFSADFSV